MKAFQDSFTQEQKATIISTLIIISDADGKNTVTNQERAQINQTGVILGIPVGDPLISTTLFYKLQKRIEILNTLSSENKEWLAVALDDYLKRVPRLSMTKLQYVMGTLNDIGITEQKFIQIVDNAKELTKRYS